MYITNYSSIFESDLKSFLKEIAVDEFNHPAWEDYIKDKDLTAYESGRNILIMGMDNEKIIGSCALIMVDEKTAKLNSFYVDKEYRSNGVGTYLYTIIENIAKRFEYEKIILCTYKEYEYATNFYNKNNFKIYKKEQNGEIWMEKNI